MFNYREHPVEPPLAEIIKKLWILDNSCNNTILKNQTVLPNGCFNIAVVQGKGASIVTNKASIDLKEGIYFCGQMTSAVKVDIFPFTKISLIQLYAWTPSRYSAIDMSIFTDLIVEFKNREEYISKMMTLRKEADLIILIEEALQKQRLKIFQNNIVMKSCSLVSDRNGDISVGELSEEIKCSTRLLQKRFRCGVGLSPKMYIKIIKLREAVDQIAFPETMHKPMTELALEQNYYDQAHFSNSFRKVVRTTPKKFIPGNYLLSLKEKK